MSQYTYILAPKTPNNYGVALQAATEFPDLIEGQQIGTAYPKSLDDMTKEGNLLVPSSNETYIYVKADTDELEASGLLDYVQDYTLYTVDTQPKSTFWLNVQ